MYEAIRVPCRVLTGPSCYGYIVPILIIWKRCLAQQRINQGRSLDSGNLAFQFDLKRLVVFVEIKKRKRDQLTDSFTFHYEDNHSSSSAEFNSITTLKVTGPSNKCTYSLTTHFIQNHSKCLLICLSIYVCGLEKLDQK